MSVSATRTVRDLALEIPNATRIFEKLGIDYCCGGGKSLEEACSAARLPVDEVLNRLEDATVPLSPARAERDWRSEPLADLIEHIVNTHHKYTREETARLQPLLDKVCSVHGKNHPELFEIRETFRGLVQELTVHLMKEEMVLFPYIVHMEEAVLQRQRVLPPPFGKIENPVRMMMQEHDSAGEALRQMREASQGYTLPADACFSYRTLYEALGAVETDLHQHIHLENNVLFPRALQIEEEH
jgi:regulator of cell morphogenesis and NO signaling